MDILIFADKVILAPSFRWTSTLRGDVAEFWLREKLPRTAVPDNGHSFHYICQVSERLTMLGWQH